MSDSDKVNGTLNNENRELFRLISLEMQVQNQRLAQSFSSELRAVDDRAERRVDAMEGRVSTQLGEIKEEQRSMRDSIQFVREKQEEQGLDIREIKTRLNDGDRRMNDIEEKQEAIAEKVQDELVEKVGDESSGDKTRDAAVAIAGTGIGGAVTWAVMKIFGGG